MYMVTFREYCDGSLWNPLTSIYNVPERIIGPVNVNWATEMAWEDFPGEIKIDPDVLKDIAKELAKVLLTGE
jgi:hypothetical protein